jgi:WD40 repeat protein
MPRLPQSGLLSGQPQPGEAVAEALGREAALGAPVTAVLALDAHFAFALGDGRIVVAKVTDIETATAVEAHSGAVLCAVTAGNAVMSGGDDGRLIRSVPGEGGTEIWRSSGRWIDHVAVSRSGRMAWSCGKAAYASQDGEAPQELAHPTSVGGLAFAPKTERLAVSYYGGVTVWSLDKGKPAKRVLEWKGSHLDVTWSPDERFVLTAMQEGALHGWRVSDRSDFGMRGYATKPRSLSWSRKGEWLATSGADEVVLWPFKGAGPAGKTPEALARRVAIVSAVACHPLNAYVAAGYKDGALLLARQEDGRDLTVRRANGAAIVAIAWARDGRRLAYGDESGRAGIVDFSPLEAKSDKKR